MSEWSDEPRDWRDARIEELEDEVEAAYRAAEERQHEEEE